MDAPVERARIGRYRILRRVSSGGMGVIYLGVAEGIGGFERLAAIKMLNPEHRDREQYVAMFMDEARIGARIQHPNLVSVQEIGEHAGELFIAMDYVHGETLGTIIRRQQRVGLTLPIAFVAEVGISIADALIAMHRGGVIHGDISPQNILVGYDGIVRVTDFGIAHTADNLFQTDGSVLRGKIGYLAPEQLLGEKPQAASDLYSLGIVLWEACTGSRLFPSEIAPSLAVAHRLATIDKIDSPDRYRPGLAPELTAVVLKALASDPKLRYPDARTMSYALRSFQIEHCPSINSQRFEEFMHELFADRIAKRRLDSLDDDEEDITLLGAGTLGAPASASAPPPALAPAPPLAPQPQPILEPAAVPLAFAETVDLDTDHTAEPITGVWNIRKNKKWIPLLASFIATVVLLFLAGIPSREKPPEPPKEVKLEDLKKLEQEWPRTRSKPRHAKRAKRIERKRPDDKLLFDGDDL